MDTVVALRRLTAVLDVCLCSEMYSLLSAVSLGPSAGTEHQVLLSQISDARKDGDSTPQNVKFKGLFRINEAN